jgi:hypothetical protein
MPISDLSSKTAPPISSETVPPIISPICPTCGKEMRLTGINPACDGTSYDYECSNDGDRISWRPHHLKSPLTA